MKNVTKQSKPQPSVEELVVVCNGTGGCSVPGQLSSLVDKTIADLDGLIAGAEAQKTRTSKIIDIVAESPVLYIQRLKRWFQNHGYLGNDSSRTRRVKRRLLDKTKNGGIENNDLSARVSNLTVVPRLLNASDVEHSIYTENRSIRKKRDTIPLRTLWGTSKKVKMSFLNNYDIKKMSPNKTLHYPMISRSDVAFGEPRSDYIKAKYARKRSDHFPEFVGPVDTPTKRIWDDDGFNQQLLLGGSVRDFSTGDQNDPTNNFQILDADHDYDAEYEYVKMNNHDSKGSEEEESRSNSGGSNEYRPSLEEGSSTGEKGEEGSHQESSVEEVSREGEEVSKEEEELSREGEDENKGGEVENADEEENNEEEEDAEKTKIVILQPTAGKDQTNFQFGVSDEDIQPRYITKDPLAGPGATRGFNHDFKAGRGVPVQGGVAVLPNTRYPTVPGFNTKQIHNILTTGKLPGTVGVGPNGTSVGIIPIEPARNARPNNLGQYLEELQPPLKSPGRAVYSRRPVGRVGIKSYKGRPRIPVYGRAPVRGQPIVYKNRPPMYRQYPVRGGTHLSYSGRGSPANMYRSRSSGRPVMRINILEKRKFEELPEDNGDRAYRSSQSSSYYSLNEQNNKPPDDHNKATESILIPVNVDSKNKTDTGENESNNDKIKLVKENSPSNTYRKKEPTNFNNGNVHDVEIRTNKNLRTRIKGGQKINDKNKMKNEDTTKEGGVNGKSKEDNLSRTKPEDLVEKSESSDDEDDISRTIAKIMRRTKEMDNERLTADGEEPVAFNKYWSLEYSYPT